MENSTNNTTHTKKIRSLASKKQENNNFVYHNMLNRFVFKDFNAIDYNLFFTICYFAVKNKNEKNLEISLDFKVLQDFLPKERNKKRFYDNVVRFALKLNGLKTSDTYFDDEGYRIFSISSFFDEIKVKEKEEKIYFKIREKSLCLIYDVMQNYTKIDIKDFCGISSKYSKILYRLLKQWEGTGEFIISFDEFCILMDIPSSYDLEKIEKKVIKPSISILNGDKNNDKIYFSNLTYEKIKEKGVGNLGRGGKVKEFCFYFEIPENRKGDSVIGKRWGRRLKNINPPPL
ncbi:replication initiation protein [Campylobacter sp. W0049]|uniref:replication initiation protein n=1 Tax=Campylobacter molothri TaxID=1032242 RepID=UPI00301D349C|nr:replication initiation protein [Campylobacter sp. W0049]